MMETLNNQAQTDSVHSQSSRSLSRSLTPTNETTTNYDNSEENLSDNEDASSNPTTTPNINDSKNLHIELIRPMESDDNVKEKKENVAVVVEYCQKDDCDNKSDNLLEKGEEYKTLNLSEAEGSCDIVKNEKSPLSISSTYDDNEFDKTQSLPITERSISVEQEKEEDYSPENKHHQEEDILSNFAKIAASLETITAAGSVNSDTQQTNSSKEYNLKVEDDNSASHCYSPESSEPEEEATKESTTKQISCERFETYDSKKDNNISSSVVQENYENDYGSGTRHNNKSNSNNSQSSTQQSLLETTAEYRNNAIYTKLCEQTIDNILAENASREKYEILENHAIATFQNSLHQKFKERTYSPLNEFNSTTIGKEIANVDETIKDEINAEEEKNKREPVVRLLQINGEGHSKSPLMCTESGSNQNLNEEEEEEQYQKMKETIPTTSYMPLKTQFMTTLDTINSVEKLHYNLEQRTLQLPQYGEDEASRSSIVSSASFSSNTSSSQHLVIDHPMDDMKEEKMKPIKKTIKRKYSATGTQRQQQQQHVDEGDDNEEPQQKKYLIMEQPEHRTCNESDNFESLQLSWQLQHKKNQLLPQTLTEDDTDGNVTQNAGSKEMVMPPVEQERQQQQPRRSSPYKSLLLQQLEKPLMPPPVLPPPPQPSIMLPSPQTKRGTIETIPQLGTPILTNTTTIPATPVATTPPLPDNTVTKYLCFQCKTGSFDSLTALTDHQMTCLNNTVLPIDNSIYINSKQKSMAAVKKSIWHKPMPPDASRTSKLQYYKCSSCQTYYENWALVLHIREQHNRYACSYCIRVFQTVEKLALHLEIKHDLEQNHYACEEALRESMILVNGCPKEARYLMCCTCQHVFHEDETFSQHDCSELIKPCTLCGQKGRHTSQCKAHPDAKCFAKPRRKKDKVFGMEKTSSSEFLSNTGGPLSLSSLSSAATRASPLPVPVPYNQTTINSNNNIPVTSLNCDKSATPMDCRVDDAGDDSNSSSNMVIDESCTTSHPISQTNPFKELDDEHERLEKQETHNYTKDINEPPDRGVLMMPIANASLMPTTAKNLIVPKFKLRVPKEFQKSVDAAFTTSESDDDDDNDDDHDDEDNDDAVDGNVNHEIMTETVNINVLESGIATEKPLLNAIDIGSNQTMSGDNTTNLSLDEDESIDEPNTNLMRIMEEIERTKMDIQRTKQRRSSYKSSAATTPQPHHNGHHEPPCSTPLATDSNVREQEILSTPSLSNSLTETECGYSEASATLLDGHNETSAAQSTEKMDIDENIVAPANISGNELELNNGATMQTTSTETDALNKRMETNETTTLSTQEKFDQLPATTLILNPDNHQLPPIDETIKAKAEEQEQEVNVCNSEGNKDDNKILENEAKQETLPADGIEVAGEETLVTELQLDRPLDKYGMIELVRICLRAVYPVCLYCNYARRIAVNGKSFVLHIISQHRFTATVDSITAEELHSDTIVAKLKSYLPELEEQYLNLTSYCSWGDGTFSLPFEERQFECFQCRFMSTIHKELYLHNRKMHLRTAILCFMCRAHFFSFSEILCHICPGIPNKVSTFEVKFRCCLCNLDGIPSPFRLMVHLRKRHFVCDVCLEDCRDQSKLSAHVWKHKLHHLCYRCGIAYRNKLDITKHLFWKHGTESTICKRCLQKRWPHVYHFCIPPSQFTCESCNLCFSKAVYLRVHKRLHAGDLRYPCAADNCEEKFISRKLLLKHAVVHDAVPPSTVPEGDNKSEENLNEEKMETENGKMLEMERKKETIIEVKEAELMKIKMEPVEDVKGGKEITKKRPLTMLNNQENIPTTTSITPTTATNEKPKELSCNSIISEKQKKKRRGKKHKRAKELLDDLNLTAPNLSESDSSSCDSGSDTKTKSEFDALPPVMLSPPSEAEDKEDGENKQQQEKTDEMVGKNSNSNTNAAGQMMEIWKNVVKTQQQQIGNKDDDTENLVTEANYTTDNYPTPRQLHVAFSDHDYCTIYSSPKSMIHSPISGTPVKLGKSPQHLKYNADNSSNSSTDSSSSSDSSCSCGSNCSCSSSDSDSSSTSSSTNHSGSSLASNNTLRKRHRKKSERDRLRKSKSESVSPQKNHNKYSTTQVNVEDIDVTEGGGGGGGLQSGDQCDKDKSPNGNKELSFHESDLETNESETDEEFYDEHPQKLANELLAEKRAQLLAQTRLSPSHKFDIVENSRPSTPSLPEEMMSGHEKSRVKVKKKKRDRKNPCKTLNANNLQYNNNNNNNNTAISNSLLQQQEQQQQQQPTLSNSSVYTPHKWTMEQSLNITRPPAPRHHSSMLSFNNNIMGRASEGSSCSDIDASLKRSKRARRPNKFYGYTSDDETNLRQSLMIGMKSYKPQPPPQLTWRKEDLPTPSKSLLNSNRNKINKKHRNSTELTSNSKKKLKLSLTLDEEEKSMQRRRKSSKKRENKLPPIPPLKIKQSQLSLSNNNNHNINNLQAQQDNNNSTESSSSAEEEDEEAEQNIILNNISNTTAAITLPFNKTSHSFIGPPPLTNPLTALLPQAPPMPPTPQTTAFNHKIPPALLPNPDFATLQYFKANNIRYPIRPPAGARQPRDGESVYCYCRCPYDEVSEMIACDGENCLIEWFHFECVGIMVAPQGKWFCAECRPKYSEELYPTNTLQATTTTTGINNV